MEKFQLQQSQSCLPFLHFSPNSRRTSAGRCSYPFGIQYTLFSWKVVKKGVALNLARVKVQQQSWDLERDRQKETERETVTGESLLVQRQSIFMTDLWQHAQAFQPTQTKAAVKHNFTETVALDTKLSTETRTKKQQKQKSYNSIMWQRSTAVSEKSWN